MAKADRPTPKKVNVDKALEELNSYKDDPIFMLGVEHGKAIRQADVLSYLQVQYTKPGAPERGSVEAKAMLKLARELSGFMKTLK